MRLILRQFILIKFVFNLLNVSVDCYLVPVSNHLSSGLYSQSWSHTQVRCLNTCRKNLPGYLLSTANDK